MRAAGLLFPRRAWVGAGRGARSLWPHRAALPEAQLSSAPGLASPPPPRAPPAPAGNWHQLSPGWGRWGRPCATLPEKPQPPGHRPEAPLGHEAWDVHSDGHSVGETQEDGSRLTGRLRRPQQKRGRGVGSPQGHTGRSAPGKSTRRPASPPMTSATCRRPTWYLPAVYGSGGGEASRGLDKGKGGSPRGLFAPQQGRGLWA